MTDWPGALLDFIRAVYRWLADGARETVEFFAEPWLQARWSVKVNERDRW